MHNYVVLVPDFGWMGIVSWKTLFMPVGWCQGCASQSSDSFDPLVHISYSRLDLF